MAILGSFWDKIANLGPIDFQIGLPIDINVNNEQKKLMSISQKIWPIFGPEQANKLAKFFGGLNEKSANFVIWDS